MSSYSELAPPPLMAGEDERYMRLSCAACGQPLQDLPAVGPLESGSTRCMFCGYELRLLEGIWRSLLPSRAAHFKQFMANYQLVRSAEGRGSEDPQFYLSLPYRDVTGKNQAQWAIRGRSFRYLERKILSALELREGSLQILDLGAGNGWMSYRLAKRGHRPVAVDLMTDSRDGLGAARHFFGDLEHPFPCVQAELDNLPFTDDQFDIAIFNASLHYSEDYARAVAEAVRCIKPGGVIVISDTAWYSCEASGARMVAERQAAFLSRFGTASDALRSLEFLTDTRLLALEEQLGLKWQAHTPYYGLRWAARPFIAKLRGSREPSKFRIYVAEVRK